MVFTPVTWTAEDIIQNIRDITGTPKNATTGQTALSDDQIMSYVNRYVSFMMPFELKEQINLQPFNFQAKPNQGVYTFTGLTQTGQPMAYADGFPLIFYQSRDIFFQDWPIQYASDNIATGNGANPQFVTATQNFPVIADGIPGGAGTFMITDGTQVITDVLSSPFNGTGTLVGDIDPAGTNTINYITGAISFKFFAATPTTSTIYDKYQGYQPARPQGVMLDATNISTTDQISLTFRPIPDQVYNITLQGFIVQNQLLTTAATPLQSEWGLLISWGAAAEIYAARGDLVAYNNLWNPQGIIKRYENIALGRFVQQLEDAQSVPRF